MPGPKRYNWFSLSLKLGVNFERAVKEILDGEAIYDRIPKGASIKKELKMLWEALSYWPS